MGVHHPRRYPSCARVLVVLVSYMYDTIRDVLVIIFDDVRTHGDDVVLLIIECILI